MYMPEDSSIMTHAQFIKKVGAKGKYNPYTVKKIIKFLKDGNNKNDSAQMSGISPDTFYTWLKEKPEFSDMVHEAIAQSKAVLIKRVTDASKHNWQAGSWLLERRYPQEYALKTVTQHTGKVDNEITIRIVPDIPQGISDKQLKQIEEVYTIDGQIEPQTHPPAQELSIQDIGDNKANKSSKDSETVIVDPLSVAVEATENIKNPQPMPNTPQMDHITPIVSHIVNEDQEEA